MEPSPARHPEPETGPLYAPCRISSKSACHRIDILPNASSCLLEALFGDIRRVSPPHAFSSNSIRPSPGNARASKAPSSRDEGATGRWRAGNGTSSRLAGLARRLQDAPALDGGGLSMSAGGGSGARALREQSARSPDAGGKGIRAQRLPDGVSARELNAGRRGKREAHLGDGAISKARQGVRTAVMENTCCFGSGGCALQGLGVASMMEGPALSCRAPAAPVVICSEHPLACPAPLLGPPRISSAPLRPLACQGIISSVPRVPMRHLLAHLFSGRHLDLPLRRYCVSMTYAPAGQARIMIQCAHVT